MKRNIVAEKVIQERPAMMMGPVRSHAERKCHQEGRQQESMKKRSDPGDSETTRAKES